MCIWTRAGVEQKQEDHGFLRAGLRVPHIWRWWWEKGILLSLLFWASQVAQVVENQPANAGDVRDTGSIPGWGRSPGEGHDNPLQYSYLENPMDRGAWRVTVHRLHRVGQNWNDLARMHHLPRHVRLFATPYAVAHQAPWSMGFSRQEYRNGLPFPSPGDFPDPGIEPASPALAGGFSTTEPPGKPKNTFLYKLFLLSPQRTSCEL